MVVYQQTLIKKECAHKVFCTWENYPIVSKKGGLTLRSYTRRGTNYYKIFVLQTKGHVRLHFLAGCFDTINKCIDHVK